jgi:hypothetical protein
MGRFSASRGAAAPKNPRGFRRKAVIYTVRPRYTRQPPGRQSPPIAIFDLKTDRGAPGGHGVGVLSREHPPLFVILARSARI